MKRRTLGVDLAKDCFQVSVSDGTERVRERRSGQPLSQWPALCRLAGHHAPGIQQRLSTKPRSHYQCAAMCICEPC